MHTNNNLPDLSKRALVITATVALFIVVVLLFVFAFKVMLLILGGVLIATYFRGLGWWLSDHTSISARWALAVVIVGTLVIAGLFTWLLGSKINSQASQLQEQLPGSFHELKNKASQYKWGSMLMRKFDQVRDDPQARQKLMKRLKGFFQGALGAAGDFYVMLFIGIFFMVAPSLYIRGIVRLVPPPEREKAVNVLNRIGRTLRSWLIGKIIAMIVVAILTAIALYIMGLPFALTLAIIAGILNFIPNFGPLAAMVPAVLLAFTKGPDTALTVALIYIAIQVVESNFITPLVQKKLIQIPPALIIIAQVFIGLLTGALGIILATPLMAIVIVLVKALYVEPMEQKNEVAG